jgi:hypothetical protein
LIRNIPESEAESAAAAGGCTALHIVDNEPLRRLLFDRNLVGLPFRKACMDASRFFVRHLADEVDKEDVAELIILSKGLVYQLGAAFATELHRNLPVNLVATTRVAVTSDDAEVEVSYSRFDAGGSTLVIGDTIASGATVVAALDAYRRSHDLCELFVFSYAGATLGAQRIQNYCDDHSIRCTLLFGLASFGLGSNGFDLSFVHPDTITKDIHRARAREQFDGKPVSAVGWDFGSQAMSPRKYSELCWIEAEVHGLHGAASLALQRKPADFSALSGEVGAFGDSLEEADLSQ